MNAIVVGGTSSSEGRSLVLDISRATEALDLVATQLPDALRAIR